MLLYLDASTPVARVCLDDSSYEKQLNRDMARDILKFLEECLAQKNATWQDLAALAVFAGPGSFTGLRIGATVMNTLSDSLSIPIISQRNSDDSKTDQGDQDWRGRALVRINNKENDKIAQPFYGAGPNITKPRK